MLHQLHFHLGSHVTQVLCCYFSSDGSTILSASYNTVKVWTFRGLRSTISDIPPLVERDLQSFLAQPLGVPLTKNTTTVIDMLCESSDKGVSFRSAVLQMVVSQLDTFCAKSTKQRDEFIRNYDELHHSVDDSTRAVSEQSDRVEMIRKQLAEAEKQLISSRQTLETLRYAEKDCFAKQRVSTRKAEELRKCCDFYKVQLDTTRSVMNQLSSKLKEHRSVSCLSQEEVLLFLQELDIPKPIRASFKTNQIGGKALELVSDRNLRELGMSDINHRKGLLHAICNVRVHGCIHVVPPPGACGDDLAAWWSAEEVWKWLEEQGFSFPCMKGMTGRTLLHLSDEDITQFGLPIGTAIKLKLTCDTLKQSFFSCSHHGKQQSEGEHHFFLCFGLMFV